MVEEFIEGKRERDWGEDNIDHIAQHGFRPEQVDEVYYGEGPYPTLAVKNKKEALPRNRVGHFCLFSPPL